MTGKQSRGRKISEQHERLIMLRINKETM